MNEVGSKLIPIELTVNGQVYRSEVMPRLHLVDFLRQQLGLTGTHVGCEIGVCGACTVLLNGRSVRACLTFAVQADKAQVETVEGLDVDGKLNRLQQSFTDCHALQCGFCTPGMLMTAEELIRKQHSPEREEIREVISGNLCRCTGYETIVDAIYLASRETAKSTE
jgi:aerobic-type carbon monoxide dehydrogenase small subunit (CoxS/CutS family)